MNKAADTNQQKQQQNTIDNEFDDLKDLENLNDDVKEDKLKSSQKKEIDKPLDIEDDGFWNDQPASKDKKNELQEDNIDTGFDDLGDLVNEFQDTKKEKKQKSIDDIFKEDIDFGVDKK